MLYVITEINKVKCAHDAQSNRKAKSIKGKRISGNTFFVANDSKYVVVRNKKVGLRESIASPREAKNHTMSLLEEFVDRMLIYVILI